MFNLNLTNLTPHTISVLARDGRTLTFPPSGTIARVQTFEAELPSREFLDPNGSVCDEQGNTNGHYLRIKSRAMGEVTGLPDDPHNPVLVSSLVLDALKGRPNTYAPDTGATAIRDEKGHIVAVTALIAA